MERASSSPAQPGLEGDIFHRWLSIEENARFEGLLKRETSNAVDMAKTAPSPAMTFRRRSLPSRAAGNRTGRQAMRGIR